MDATTRFSDRVDNYLRFRPSYPDGVLEFLRTTVALRTDFVIADIGSGTGISTEPFLRNGNTVFGVEPNSEMRRAAEVLLQAFPKFHSVDGRAEATTLSSGSIDFVIAAQAFHWFAAEATRAELARILRPHGWCVLFWNVRRSDSTPFLRDYERLLQTFGTDYQQVQHRNIDAKQLSEFFVTGTLLTHRIDNEQRLDFAGLEGRLLSSSYAPTAPHPNFAPMIQALASLYQRHADSEGVVFEYDTEIYVGRIN